MKLKTEKNTEYMWKKRKNKKKKEDYKEKEIKKIRIIKNKRVVIIQDQKAN